MFSASLFSKSDLLMLLMCALQRSIKEMERLWAKYYLDFHPGKEKGRLFSPAFLTAPESCSKYKTSVVV